MSSEQRHQRVQELFLRSLALKDEERFGFLEAQCGGDHDLLEEVLALLRVDAEPAGPLGGAEESGTASSGDDTASSQLIQKLTSHKPQRPRYRLVGELARGGMGVVLKVWDDDLERPLAMKVILGQAEAVSRGETPPVDARKLNRFLEEAQITGQLDHPGIVPVHELGIDDSGQVFFTMRLVKGMDFKHVLGLLRRGAEDWNLPRALGVLQRVCEAMAFAHSHGVIHRDLKPSNVMVGRFGEVYVMDWGLGCTMRKPDTKDIRIAGEPASAASEVRTYRARGDDASDAPLVTRDGDVLGTPAYMSPEQARGELAAMGKHSDVYSVGAILYEVLTGQRPYDAGFTASPFAVWHRVLEGPPRPIESHERAVAPELVAVCEKAMAREPAQRYADMQEMAEELRAFLEGRVVRAYRTGAIAELKKWVARNRFAAASLAALLLVALASVLFIAEISRRRAREDTRAWLERSVPGYVARADELFPIHPDAAPAMREWLRGARELIVQRPRLEAELRELRAGGSRVEAAELDPRSAEQEEAAAQVDFLVGILQERLDLARRNLETLGDDYPARSEDEAALAILPREVPALRSRAAAMHASLAREATWSFPTERLRGRHERVERVLRGLRRLDGPDGLVSAVAQRLRSAEELADVTVDEHREEWEAALASIADRAECPAYRGWAPSPQVGLVPLRRDPVSGLWEFWHHLSGERPEPLPGGGYRMDADSGLVLVLLPAGEVLLGAQAEDPGAARYDEEAQPSEGPLLRVELAPCFLSRYELTQGQYERAAGHNPSERFAGLSARGNPRIGRTNPVEHVSWEEGRRALARWSLELPTEAQWERAARAGSELRYGTTARFADTYGTINFKDRAAQELSTLENPLTDADFDDGYSTHAPVDAFPANPLGFHQMLGNVAEWTRDAYCPDYGQYMRVVVPGTGELRPHYSNARTVRGGHYESEPADLRVSRRIKRMPTFSDRNVGLRPARAVDP